jgi:hypothetical protein
MTPEQREQDARVAAWVQAIAQHGVIYRDDDIVINDERKSTVVGNAEVFAIARYVQAALAAREAEVAGLKADVAFKDALIWDMRASVTHTELVRLEKALQRVRDMAATAMPHFQITQYIALVQAESIEPPQPAPDTEAVVPTAGTDPS